MYKMKNRYSEVAPKVWQQWPLTREESEIQQLVYYLPLKGSAPCDHPEHGDQSVYYTKTGIARCCAIMNSCNAYNNAVREKMPVSASEAIKLCIDHYYEIMPGKYCGHIGKKTLDGKCFICEEEKSKNKISSRQIAMVSGEKWYMPEDNKPCKNGHIALRRVDNGRCSECERTREPQIYDLYPDMILSRTAAAALGFKFYRTGEKCSAGHTGWRYLSSGNCIECIKSKG